MFDLHYSRRNRYGGDDDALVDYRLDHKLLNFPQKLRADIIILV